MSILLPALGVTFAAFCVWLTVRVVNRRERWARWTAAGLAVLVLYAASLPPMVYLHDHGYLPQFMSQPIRLFYAPLGQILWWLGVIRD